MATKTKTAHSPNYRTQLTVDQFADKVHILHSSVVHGDDPLLAARKAQDNWRLLDPIDTTKGPEASMRRARLSAALGKTVVVASEAAGGRKVRDWPVASFHNQLLLDKSVAEIAQGTSDDTTRSQLAFVVGEGNEGGKRNRKNVEGKFDALSAKAMLLHMRSRELDDKKVEPWQRRGTEAVLKASLGGLIKESVGGLRDIHDDYSKSVKGGGNGSHLSGRLVETMYFTYRLMEWYKSEGALGSGYPRFALFREDKPMVTPLPRRSFDVAVMHTQQEPELVQVKASHTSTYAEGVTVWHPQAQPKGIVDETEQVMGWFDTIVDNEVPDTDIQMAWRNLTARFADPAEAAN